MPAFLFLTDGLKRFSLFQLDEAASLLLRGVDPFDDGFRPNVDVGADWIFLFSLACTTVWYPTGCQTHRARAWIAAPRIVRTLAQGRWNLRAPTKGQFCPRLQFFWAKSLHSFPPTPLSVRPGDGIPVFGMAVGAILFASTNACALGKWLLWMAITCAANSFPGNDGCVEFTP